MLKPLVIAAGALLTVTLVANQPASAAGYRTSNYRQPVNTQRIYSRAAYPRSSYRGAGYARVGYARVGYSQAGYARVGYARAGYAQLRNPRVGYAKTYPRQRYATRPILRQRRINLVRGIAAYRTVRRSRFGRAAITAARNVVGPRSTYMRTATPVVGAGGQTGQASYYALTSRTASGGSVGAATCAHRYLPFGTRILVTNLANAHQMVLTVNDRGPFIGGRILDVSRSAAGYLGMLGSGTAPVRIQVVGHS